MLISVILGTNKIASSIMEAGDWKVSINFAARLKIRSIDVCMLKIRLSHIQSLWFNNVKIFDTSSKLDY